jgi:hypothetical protein
LFSYLEQLVIPELQVTPTNKLDDLPLLKATSIKFLYFFRNQIPDAQVQFVAVLMADYLKAESVVTQSYASACIEKMLTRKRLDNQPGNVMTEQSIT